MRAGPRASKASAQALPAALLAASGVACLSGVDLELPQAPEGARSLLLVFASGDRKPLELAIALDETGSPKRSLALSLPAGGDRWALFLLPSLSQLQLEEGLVPALGMQEGRPVFSNLETYRLAADKSKKSDWQRRIDVPREIAQIRLPAFDAPACARSGGCIASVPSIEALCEIPCPEPSPVQEPAAPRRPRATDLSPCLPGWTAVTATTPVELTDCEPARVRAPRMCGPGEMQLADQDRCTLVGGACGAGDWSDSPGPEPVLYVKPGMADGTGSRASPFGSIAQAITHSVPGATIALAKGRYTEAVMLPAGVALVGACPLQTVIEPPSQPFSSAVVAQGPGARIANLSLRGSDTGVLVQSGGAVAIEDAVIERVAMNGVVATASSSVELRRSALLGCGVVCLHLTKATATVSLSLLEGGVAHGIFAVSSTVTVSSAIVRNRGTGIGIGFFENSRGLIQGSLVELVETGFQASGTYGKPSAVIDRLYVLGGPQAGPRLNAGGVVIKGRLDMKRVTVVGAAQYGLLAAEGSEVKAGSVLVSGLHPEDRPDCGGYGVFAVNGTKLEISGGAIIGSGCGGLLGGDRATLLRLEDLVIAGDRGRGPRRGLDAGILCVAGCQLNADRIAVSETITGGITVIESDLCTVNDAFVTRSGFGGEMSSDGFGITLDRCPSKLVRVRVEQSKQNGIAIKNQPSPAVLSDIVVTHSGTEGLTLRHDLERQVITLQRASITDSGTDGIAARGNVDLRCSDLSIARVQIDAGIRVGFHARATLERFLLSEGALSNAWVESLGALELTDGVVEGSKTGARIDCRTAAGCDDAFALQRLLVRVRYLNTERPIE